MAHSRYYARPGLPGLEALEGVRAAGGYPPMNRAEVLAEALPYIEEFQGAYVVLKYVGHAMLDEEAMDWTIKDTILLKYVGMKPVVVHGGGPEISKAMEKRGKKPQLVEGPGV